MSKKGMKQLVRAMVKEEILTLFGKDIQKSKYYPQLVEEGMSQISQDVALRKELSRYNNFMSTSSAPSLPH